MATAYTYNNLISLTSTGLDVASDAQIRDALINRMKEIYGNDIEVSSASADGQYINMETMLLRNMYNSCSEFIRNMNPENAGGMYLDIICSLSNIHRKPATYSSAQVCIKNISGNTKSNITTIILFDKTGNTWTWSDLTPITLANNATINLTFTCGSLGPIAATAVGETPDWTATEVGDICRPLEASIYKCWQLKDAVLGSDEEDDLSLRRRQQQTGGTNAQTTLSALKAAIYNLPGVKDVYIVNNNTSAAITTVAGMSDGTTVASHNVYICIKYDGANEDSIAATIISKMTPGVYTQQPATSGLLGGTSKEKIRTFDSGLSCPIYWKKCSPVHPTITVNFTYYSNYTLGDHTTVATAITEQEKDIESAILTTCNDITIGEKLFATDVSSAIMGADRATSSSFYVTSCVFPSSASVSYAPWTYYDYSTVTFAYTPSQQDPTTGTCVLTVS